MNDFWHYTFLGNSISDLITACVIIILGFVITRFFKIHMLKRLKKWSSKTQASFDDFLIKCIERSVVPFLYFLIIYIGISYLNLPQKVADGIKISMLLLTTFFTLRIINTSIEYFADSLLKKQEDGVLKQKQTKGLIVIIKGLIWILGIIFLLDNLGYNVTTLIAGLGIGGIAIALAAQTILGDLFSYFVILFDRPFEVGDFIIVDDKMGVVEYIGIKTTRLRTLAGEQLICSNKDLTDSRVHNYKRMEKRRVVFGINITYQTPADLVEITPQLIKNIISNQTDVVFDRAHFSGFGEFSLKFECVYYVLTSDYNIYMDIQQSIYLAIIKKFETEDIQFAYPTQTVFLKAKTTPLHNHN